MGYVDRNGVRLYVAVRRALVESNFLPTDDSARRRDIVATVCAVVPLPAAAAMFRAATRWTGVGALRLCGAPVLVLLSATRHSNGGEFATVRSMSYAPGVMVALFQRRRASCGQ
jgi:hypothetical protein